MRLVPRRVAVALTVPPQRSSPSQQPPQPTPSGACCPPAPPASRSPPGGRWKRLRHGRLAAAVGWWNGALGRTPGRHGWPWREHSHLRAGDHSVARSGRRAGARRDACRHRRARLDGAPGLLPDHCRLREPAPAGRRGRGRRRSSSPIRPTRPARRRGDRRRRPGGRGLAAGERRLHAGARREPRSGDDGAHALQTISSTAGYLTEPRIAASAQGTSYLSWLETAVSFSPPYTGAITLRAATRAPGAATFAPGVQVTKTTTAEFTDVQLLVDEAGTASLAWAQPDAATGAPAGPGSRRSSSAPPPGRACACRRRLALAGAGDEPSRRRGARLDRAGIDAPVRARCGPAGARWG